jgi:hypothetical protein
MSFPEAVRLSRFAAPRFVFIFGIEVSFARLAGAV